MPENKATPTPEVKKPDTAAKAPGTPPSTEQKPPAAPQAPQAPKAAAPAEKKPGDPPKEPPKVPPAPPTTPPPPPKKEPPKDAPKQTEEKGKATEPKQAEVPKPPADGKKPTVAEKPGEKKPDTKDAAPPPKAAAPTEPKEPADKKPEEKKPDGKAPATDPKPKAAPEPKKPDPKAAPGDAAKGAPAADPKKKDAAVEPPKGVKITQIFADRLDKPTQEDLKSLPIPQEGEGFSMRLHPAYFFEFLNHPFSVNRETDDYRELYDSIKENGINEPIKARPREGGGLELISGHRRHDVAMQLNYPVPVVIVQADNDSAQIECVDGNLHRKDIPTSELARAAKMKIEAMTRKAGRRTKMEKLTSPQKRTDQIVAEEMGYSRTQLTRLVRIDSLVPEMKQMVDSKKLPFNVAVELSYMSEPEQRDLVSVMKKEQTVPSLAQALQMKEASQKAALAAKEAAKAPKPPLQVVSTPTKADQGTTAAPSSADPKAAATTPAPTQPAYTPPAPVPAPKPPAQVDAKKFASIMKNKPEPELKVTFTGAELKDFFPDRTPTVPEVKRTVFEALEIRKKAMEKQAKKNEIKNPAR